MNRQELHKIEMDLVHLLGENKLSKNDIINHFTDIMNDTEGKELHNDLVTAWNEINEALTSINDLSEQEILSVLPTIKERLGNAQKWIGKYVGENDVLEEL